jgi:hypothetical protein
MTLREALLNKKRSIKVMNHIACSWQIYGEETLVLFYKDWEFSSSNLDKLLGYLNLADKLVIALPENTSDDTVFKLANLQVIDGIILYSSVEDTIQAFTSAKFGFEGTAIPSSAREKSRLLAI